MVPIQKVYTHPGRERGRDFALVLRGLPRDCDNELLVFKLQPQWGYDGHVLANRLRVQVPRVRGSRVQRIWSQRFPSYGDTLRAWAWGLLGIRRKSRISRYHPVDEHRRMLVPALAVVMLRAGG